MKRLLKHIALFLLPIVMLLVLLPVNNRIKYLGLKDDCSNRGIWIHDRIFENDSSIDVAFLGSSHTTNSINDQIISEAWGLSCVNLGYCRLGRNLTYVMAKNVIQEHHPGKLIMEVRTGENRYSHPIFPYMASTKDVLLPYLFFNKDILNDCFLHLNYKIELFQDMLFREYHNQPIQTNFYGFASHPDTAKANTINSFYENRHKPRKEISIASKHFYNKYPKGYLKKIIRLCEKTNTTLVFLYIPSYGLPDTIPEEYAYYNQYGTVILPPNRFFSDKNLWYDENHLNEAGGDKLSKWISKNTIMRDISKNSEEASNIFP